MQLDCLVVILFSIFFLLSCCNFLMNQTESKASYMFVCLFFWIVLWLIFRLFCTETLLTAERVEGEKRKILVYKLLGLGIQHLVGITLFVFWENGETDLNL